MRNVVTVPVLVDGADTGLVIYVGESIFATRAQQTTNQGLTRHIAQELVNRGLED